MKKIISLTIISIFILAACSHQANNTSNSQNNTKPAMEEKNQTSGLMVENIVTIPLDLTVSKLDWSGENVVGSSHQGNILLKSGEFKLTDQGQFVGGEFVIDMTSIKDQDGSTRLEEHLKSDDFFSVSTFPEAKFTITDVVNIAVDDYTITGNLTIKEITNPITFTAQIKIDNERISAKADIVFDRSLWDVRYGSGKFFDNEWL